MKLTSVLQIIYINIHVEQFLVLVWWLHLEWHVLVTYVHCHYPAMTFYFQSQIGKLNTVHCNISQFYWKNPIISSFIHPSYY